MVLFRVALQIRGDSPMVKIIVRIKCNLPGYFATLIFSVNIEQFVYQAIMRHYVFINEK